MSDTFGANLSFLRLLNLVKEDSGVREALDRKDFSLINSFPGLTEEERKILKLFNWKNIEIDLTDDDINNFQPGLVAAEETVCERKIVTEVAERKCFKL